MTLSGLSKYLVSSASSFQLNFLNNTAAEAFEMANNSEVCSTTFCCSVNSCCSLKHVYSFFGATCSSYTSHSERKSVVSATKLVWSFDDIRVRLFDLLVSDFERVLDDRLDTHSSGFVHVSEADDFVFEEEEEEDLDLEDSD